MFKKNRFFFVCGMVATLFWTGCVTNDNGDKQEVSQNNDSEPLSADFTDSSSEELSLMEALASWRCPVINEDCASIAEAPPSYFQTYEITDTDITLMQASEDMNLFIGMKQLEVGEVPMMVFEYNGVYSVEELRFEENTTGNSLVPIAVINARFDAAESNWFFYDGGYPIVLFCHNENQHCSLYNIVQSADDSSLSAALLPEGEVPQPFTNALVQLENGDICAGGAGITCYAAGTWTTATTETEGTIARMYRLKTNEIVAAGTNGGLWLRQDEQWQRQDTSVNWDFVDVAFSYDFWAATGTSQLYFSSGTYQWSCTLPITDATAVYASSLAGEFPNGAMTVISVFNDSGQFVQLWRNNIETEFHSCIGDSGINGPIIFVSTANQLSDALGSNAIGSHARFLRIERNMFPE